MVNPKKKHSLLVFLRAQLSAQFATLADFVLTYVCFKWLGMYYVLATSIGAIIGGLINCIINYKWAFATKDCQFKWVFLKYILVWVGSFVLNVGGVYLLVEFLQDHTHLWERASSFYLIVAKIIVSALIAVGWNYVLHRYFVFQDANIQRRFKSIFKKQNDMDIKKFFKSKRDGLQQAIYFVINPLVRGMIKIGFTPNTVTTIGFLGNLAAAGLFIYAGKVSTPEAPAYDWVGWAGLTIILSSLFDMLDGQVARIGNMTSTFGAMYDSVLDRYCELVTLGGICFFLNDTGYATGAIITFAALVGSIMVSYVRARAEGLDIECKVGFMQRPERVVVTSLSAIICGLVGHNMENPSFDPMLILIVAMDIIAVFANLTAYARIMHCRKALSKK